MQAAAAPDAITVTGTVTTSPLSASVAATSGASTASANTEETEPVLASTPPGTQTGRHTTEAPASPIAAAAAAGAAPARPQPAQPAQPRPKHTGAQANPPAERQVGSPVRAVAVSAQTVTVPTGPTGPQPSSAAAAGAIPAAAAGYGLLPPQGGPQASAQAPGSAGHPVPDPSGPPILTASQQADQSSAVAAAGAVPADAVGSHRKAAVTVSTAGTAGTGRTAGTAAPAGPEQGTDPAMQETMTIPTNPSAATAIPTATSWSSAAQPLQDSGRLPRARGA